MSRDAKLLRRVMGGMSDANIHFYDLCALLRHLGFAERVRGSHHIFSRDGVPEILNIQPRGHQAKAYQVKQVREVVMSNGLREDSAAESTDDGPDSFGPEGSEDGG